MTRLRDAERLELMCGMCRDEYRLRGRKWEGLMFNCEHGQGGGDDMEDLGGADDVRG